MYYRVTIKQWPIITILIIKCDPVTLAPLGAAIYDDGGYYRLTRDKRFDLLTNYEVTLNPTLVGDNIRQLLD